MGDPVPSSGISRGLNCALRPGLLGFLVVVDVSCRSEVGNLRILGEFDVLKCSGVSPSNG